MLVEPKTYEKEIERCLNRKLSKKERDKLKDAYEFAEKAHEGQKRDSGEIFLSILRP